jgi:hypothetical protein
MKKLILIAGLAGIVVTGAFAQGNGGTSVNASVTVLTYMNVDATGTLAINITNGGFLPLYTSNTVSFTVTGNVATNLASSYTGLAKYTVTPLINGLATTPVPYPIGIAPAQTVSFSIPGNGTTGIAPDTLSTGTVVLTLTQQP